MSFTVFGVFGSDAGSSVVPVTQPTFHYSMKQEQFFFGSPIFCEERKVQLFIKKTAVA